MSLELAYFWTVFSWLYFAASSWLGLVSLDFSGTLGNNG
jgi:hypothetical protein